MWSTERPPAKVLVVTGPEIAALVSAVVSLLTAVTALVKAFTATRTAQAALKLSSITVPSGESG